MKLKRIPEARLCLEPFLADSSRIKFEFDLPARFERARAELAKVGGG